MKIVFLLVLPPPPSYDRMDDPFTFDEFSSVLDHLHDSSPGIDGIPYSFIKKCSDSSKLILLSIINQIYVTGIVPDSWKHQIIIPILKPNKDPNDPSSYKPIALSSVLATIMEHPIKNRLEWILENRAILSKTQFGFRMGMGGHNGQPKYFFLLMFVWPSPGIIILLVFFWILLLPMMVSSSRYSGIKCYS